MISKRAQYDAATERMIVDAWCIPGAVAAVIVFVAGGWLLTHSFISWLHTPLMYPVGILVVLALLLVVGVALSSLIRFVRNKLYETFEQEDQEVTEAETIRRKHERETIPADIAARQDIFHATLLVVTVIIVGIIILATT